MAQSIPLITLKQGTTRTFVVYRLLGMGKNEFKVRDFMNRHMAQDFMKEVRASKGRVASFDHSPTPTDLVRWGFVDSLAP